MVWEKAPDGSDVYSLCYAPSLRAGSFGVSSGRMQCDAGSYFMVEAPKFCCRHARIEVAGKRTDARGEVCGDVLAEFDHEHQKIRYVRGPTTTGSSEQLTELGSNGLGDGIPSHIAFQALKEGSSWADVASTKCQGRSGTLISWLHSVPPNRAELCPTGTTPVQGAGYWSWACDGMYTTESLLHCCKVKGKLRCVHRLSENERFSQCNCGSPSAATSSAWPMLLLLQLAGASLLARGPPQQTCVGRGRAFL